MADDFGFYDLAVQFPQAVLAMLGLDPTLPYRGEALEVKASGRFDAVLSPDPLVLVPVTRGAPRIYLEFQGRHDHELEERLLMKIAVHRLHDPPSGKVRAVIFFTERRFLESTRPGDIGEVDDPLVAFRVERIVLPQLDPGLVEAAGPLRWLLLPLVTDRGTISHEAARWSSELRAALARTPEALATARDLFTKFVAHRLPDTNVYALLKEEVMRDTATGQAILAEGRKEGLKEGVKEGVKEGLRRGVLDILDARGLSIPVEARARLDAETDPDRLARIHRAALRVGPDLAGLFPD